MMNLSNALYHLKFFKKKPRVIFRILKDFFNRLILQKNVLRTIDIAVNYDCHFKCEFCSAASLRNEKRSYLTSEEIKKLVREAQNLGAIHVNFTGGEPLLRNIAELCNIMQNIQPKEMLISLVTNGLNCTEEIIKKLKENGLDTLQVSIESIDPNKHDLLRGGGGNWEKSIKTAEYAKNLGLNICLNTVLFKDNFEEVEKLAKLCKDKGYFLTINIASSVGNWKGKRKTKVNNKFLSKLKRLLGQGHIRNDTSWNFNLKRGCPGGTERIYVTAYGDVLTCPLVHVSYGNVLKESLKDIYNRMNKFIFIKKWNHACKHAFDENYYKNICKPSEEEKNPPLSINRIENNYFAKL